MSRDRARPRRALSCQGWQRRARLRQTPPGRSRSYNASPRPPCHAAPSQFGPLCVSSHQNSTATPGLSLPLPTTPAPPRPPVHTLPSRALPDPSTPCPSIYGRCHDRQEPSSSGLIIPSHIQPRPPRLSMTASRHKHPVLACAHHSLDRRSGPRRAAPRHAVARRVNPIRVSTGLDRLVRPGLTKAGIEHDRRTQTDPAASLSCRCHPDLTRPIPAITA